MLLEGSCHCGAVRFKLRSAHPYPFNLCYCSICRKPAGGGGYAINLGAGYLSQIYTHTASAFGPGNASLELQARYSKLEAGMGTYR